MRPRAFPSPLLAVFRLNDPISSRRPRRDTIARTPHGPGLAGCLTRKLLLIVTVLTALAASASLAGQTVVVKDPVAVTIMTQALTALNGTTTLADATVQASAIYAAGSDLETGSATLEATTNQQSHTYLYLTGGQRQEIRNGPAGDWIGPDGAAHVMATHNCWTDATWFFPGLTLESALNDPQIGIVYIGQETRGGVNVRHLQFSRSVSDQTADVTAWIQQLSLTDLYVDPASSLPVALVFNVHPDFDANTDMASEIDYASYGSLSGLQVPLHVQRFVGGNLMLDISVNNVAVNSGIPQSEFAVQ